MSDTLRRVGNKTRLTQAQADLIRLIDRSDSEADKLRAEIASLRAQLDEARARVAKLEKELEVEDHSHEQTVEDRDVAEDWADKLVERVEQLLDVDCGEHSNLNSPWKEACDYLDGAIANLAKPSSADEARRKAIEDAVNTAEQHSRLDVRCKCGFEIAEDIRALLSESKT